MIFLTLDENEARIQVQLYDQNIIPLCEQDYIYVSHISQYMCKRLTPVIWDAFWGQTKPPPTFTQVPNSLSRKYLHWNSRHIGLPQILTENSIKNAAFKISSHGKKFFQKVIYA